jgi:hypothetical protein
VNDSSAYFYYLDPPNPQDSHGSCYSKSIESWLCSNPTHKETDLYNSWLKNNAYSSSDFTLSYFSYLNSDCGLHDVTMKVTWLDTATCTWKDSSSSTFTINIRASCTATTIEDGIIDDMSTKVSTQALTQNIFFSDSLAT